MTNDQLREGICRLLSGRIPHVLLLLQLLAFPLGEAVSKEEMIFGIYPFMQPAELLKKFTPLTEYLSSVIGRPIRIEIVKDYQTHIQMTGENRRDIAYLGPVPYVRTVEKYGSKPILALLEVNGKNTFQGVFIVRRDSKLKSLSDLAGKRFAFGDPDSTMSHLVPWYMLLKAGVGKDKLGEFECLNNHKAIAMGVLAGMFDAGAVKESVFRQFEARGLRALARTLPIAAHIFVTRSNMPEQTLHALRQAIAKLGQEADGPAILHAIKPSVTALKPGKDSDFDKLRSILQALDEAGATLR
ncbi:MAG: phosphate/phosphite/phosphonate ABC transporter substrate-binding protein [Gammaproteobacteria bacterium]|nr:phosphate/phosphite/phosphonate ABC transporter substrate-binding protein [Gammaproteobacteria bacterium]